jgi:hypothetical protein
MFAQILEITTTLILIGILLNVLENRIRNREE